MTAVSDKYKINHSVTEHL